MIYFDSRYADSEVRLALDSRTSKHRFTAYREWPVVSSEFFYYEWVEGDRIDWVSEKFLGKPNLWWRVMDANPEVLDPLTILPGTLLRIPND